MSEGRVIDTSMRLTLTAKETASVMGISLSLLYKLLKQGRFPITAHRLGDKWVFPVSEVDAWARHH